MTAAERLLPKLQGVRPSGSDRWIACCPAHPDRTPSLSIRTTDDRVLVYCHAGCQLGEILQAVGIQSMRELFDAAPDTGFNPVALKKRLAIDALQAWADKRLNSVCEQLRNVDRDIELQAGKLKLYEDGQRPRDSVVENLVWGRLGELLTAQRTLDGEFETLNFGTLQEKLELWRRRTR